MQPVNFPDIQNEQLSQKVMKHMVLRVVYVRSTQQIRDIYEDSYNSEAAFFTVRRPNKQPNIIEYS